MPFLIDIDFAEFNRWWTSNSPSIFSEPIPTQNALVYYDADHISIAGWRFNVKSRIHRLANTKDVIDGWDLIDKNLKIVGKSIVQLYRPFFKIMLIDYNRIKSLSSQSLSYISLFKGEMNLGIISLLQLAYWYKKCSIYSTFNVKENELRQKLIEIIEFIKSFDEAEDLEFKLLKLRNNLDDCVSELMFAGMTSVPIPNISFDNKHDFLIKDIPCEVKTIHDEIIIDNDASDNQIVMTKKETFGQISLKAETLEQILRSKYLKHLSNAVSQGGRIVFVNASFSTIAHDLPMIDFNKDVNGDDKFAHLVDEAVSYVSTNHYLNALPVIVDVGIPAYEKGTFRWYHTCYSFKAPVIYDKHNKISLDLGRYNQDMIVNDLTLDEALFNKYPIQK
jgi:hypothetical protein